MSFSKKLCPLRANQKSTEMNKPEIAMRLRKLSVALALAWSAHLPFDASANVYSVSFAGDASALRFQLETGVGVVSQASLIENGYRLVLDLKRIDADGMARLRKNCASSMPACARQR